MSGGGNPEANVKAVDTTDILDDIPTNTYVKYVTQSLTDAQKEQARANIGAQEKLTAGTLYSAHNIRHGDRGCFQRKRSKYSHRHRICFQLDRSKKRTAQQKD